MSKTNCSYCPRPKKKTKLSGSDIDKLLNSRYVAPKFEGEKPEKREYNFSKGERVKRILNLKKTADHYNANY